MEKRTKVFEEKMEQRTERLVQSLETLIENENHKTNILNELLK